MQFYLYITLMKLIKVTPKKDYVLYLEYDDGVKWNLNLSHLVGKWVFSCFSDYNFFEKAHVDPETWAIAWNNELDICPDSAYMRISGKKIF